MGTDLTAVRELLKPAPTSERPWMMLGAALLAAFAAVTMAGVMVLGPGVQFDDAAVVVAPQP